jgi:hypothetical protein
MHIFDMLVFAHCGWALLALINWGGVAQGIESGGIYIVEFAGAYLLARVYIRGYEDFAAVAKLYVGLVLGTLDLHDPRGAERHPHPARRISGALGGPMAPYHRAAHGAGADLRALRPPDPLRRLFGGSAFSLAYFVSPRRG